MAKKKSVAVKRTMFRPTEVLMPGDHVDILPGAKSCWLSQDDVDDLETHFVNDIPKLQIEIESIYGTLNGKKVLDLGCGPARLPEIFPDMAFYIGVDQAALMVGNAIERYPDRNFVCSRIEDYRNPNGFDVVTCIDVLQHLANPPEQLLRRVLVLFDAETFIFRTFVNSLTTSFRYDLVDGHAATSYPLSYFAELVKSVNKHTDCVAELKILSMPKNNDAEGIFIVCKRKPII